METMSRKSAGSEIERLVGLLARLPGLGSRSARKAALALLKRRSELLEPLAAALSDAAAKIVECGNCGNLDTVTPCTICQDPRRDASLIVEVEASQRRYDDCILHLNIRNDLLFEIVHPMAARAGIMGKPITMEQFKQALGDMHFARWETAATSVYQAVPATLEAMPKVAAKLRDAGRRWFPRRKFIERIDIPVS